MNKIQFLKNHLLDFEFIPALCIGALLRYGFNTSWLVAILFGMSAFALNIPQQQGPVKST